MQTNWHNKPYYSLDAYCKNTFGRKVYKIALDGGMTCPNRDGSLAACGCIFCSGRGSGDFAAPNQGNIQNQLEKGLELFHLKKVGTCFIAYFQAYTNTYAPTSYLRSIYTEALMVESIIGISIATRPDCISLDVLHLIRELKLQFPNKFIWIELGLQSIHEQTATYIRRCYPLSCFDDCVARLHAFDIPVITHVILGLPFETKRMMLETIDYLNHQPVFGIKLQLLHVLKETDLEKEYLNHSFDVLSMEEYLDILTECIERLSPQIVIHRVTGDGPRELLVAPLWSLDKRGVLNTLHQKMKQNNLQQGRAFYDTRTIDSL